MSTPTSSPEYNSQLAPSPAVAAAAASFRKQSPSKIIGNLSPPLIAMFAVIGAALLIVLYARLLSRQIRRLHRRYRRWRRCRHILRSAAASESHHQFSPPPAAFPFDSFSDHPLSPYGLDDAAIKTLPLSVFSRSKAKQPASTSRDCAVCLFEFDDGEWLRTLPVCAHAFHVECIDAWLRSHPTCPLCRAAVSFRAESPFVPMRAARIRPSLDEIVVAPPVPEENFLLKRSYSFGFERSVGACAETTVSPAWRVRQQQQGQQHRGFWSRRWASPFGGGGSARPYYHRGGGSGVMKSPFVRRFGFVPVSGVGGGRRCRSMTSPTSVGFSSSRMRCGDPEALLSPERFSRR